MSERSQSASHPTSHRWADARYPFRHRFSNADPEHSVDGRHADAGRASLVPMAIFLAVAVLLMIVYAQYSA